MFLEFLLKKRASHFLKSALCVGTACSKWLKQALRNTHIKVLPNIWGLGQVRDTKFGTNVSNEKLLNAAKCQGYSFYCFFEAINPIQDGGTFLSPPTSISPVIFTNVELSSQNFQAFSFNPFLDTSVKFQGHT